MVLLSPVGGPSPYFAEFGWLAESGVDVALPDKDTVWRADGAALTPESPVTLTWDNGAGLVFARTFALDGEYMFTVTQSVANTGDVPVALLPYGRIKRYGTPATLGFYILHEGLIGVFDETLEEVDYDDLSDPDEPGEIAYRSADGWIGITDKYWLTALIPDQSDPFNGRFLHHPSGGVDTYQADFYRGPIVVEPGDEIAGPRTGCSPAPRWWSCSTPTPRPWACPCSTAPSTSAGSTS